MSSNVIAFFPFHVAREKARYGDPAQINNTPPLTTLFARHLLLSLGEPLDDMTITWALGFNNISNLIAMELWVSNQLAQPMLHRTAEHQLDQLKKALRDTLGNAANDGLYDLPNFMPRIFEE